MSRNGSAHLTSPLHSRPSSRASSTDQDLVSSVKPTSVDMVALNVLFLGEIDIGEKSTIDLIADPKEQERTPHHVDRRAPGNIVNSVTIDGKIFKLHALPTTESVATVALSEGVQNTLTNLLGNGGIHLLVYCMNPSHSPLWIHEIHRTITSNSTLYPHIPAVAVVAGMSDVAQEERWWFNNQGTLASQGLCFDDHVFIGTMATNSQSPTGDHISESRRILRALILRNYACALDSETRPDFQHSIPYKQRSIGNSFHSLRRTMSVGKTSFLTSTSSKAIDVVLLGETGVGKSSLINLIAREDIAEVSSDTIRCTKTTAKYTFVDKGRMFHLYDTPGLVDPEMGVKPFVDPIDAIQKLIRSLSNGNGPNLLLFCIDNSKPTAALRRNYHLFFKIICDSNVPFVLAVTKLEEGQDAGRWWNQYGATVQSYGIDCSGHVGIVHKKNSSLGSEEQLRESILSLCITCGERQKQTSSLPFAMRRIRSSVNSILRSYVLILEGMLRGQCGLEKQVARELAYRIASA